MSRATALAGRTVAYAMVFVNESEDEVTDEGLAQVLAACVRPARAEEYPAIRLEVETWRRYGMTSAELAELEDDRLAWSVTRGSLNRIAGRKLTEEEVREVAKGLSILEAEAVTDVVHAVCGGRDGQ